MTELPEAIRELLPRLRAPEFTRILVVTLAEATPVHEAAGLQRELLRAGILPYGWVLNQALLPLKVTDPRLLDRRNHQFKYVREVLREHTNNAAVVPWMMAEPVGAEGLQDLLREDLGGLTAAAGVPAPSGRARAVERRLA
jgi:arsenite-transporting ATPase